jgi:hypothetical protein
MPGEPVEIIRLPEGESGLIPERRLSERTLQSMASFWAIPYPERRRRYGTRSVNDDIVFLASRLGISRGLVRRSLRSRKLLDRVNDECTAASILLVPAVLDVQFRKAIERGDTKAATLVLQFLKKVPEPGGNVNVNIGVGVNIQQHERTIQQDQANLATLAEMRETGEIDRLLGANSGPSR